MTRPTITLACIMKNEEENIPRLLKSVEGCFDEIILTDTGSTDRSVEVAESLGAKVRSFPWVDDFSAARNASFENVSTDFVMWLDLDDVLENPEGFKLWRDTAMGLADYWIATYHYSSDASGRPVCSFARERVFRVSKGLRWKYFVHEGVVPGPEYGPVQVQGTASWAVRHMRTEQDLLKDRSRNLSLFELPGRVMDARMLYYYGKELFEANKPFEAATKLGEAISRADLEMHDRILGMQYCCYAYIQLNQFDKALQLAQAGLLLAPTRAEFFGIIGDCYLKTNRIAEAIPSFHAAKGCSIPPSSGVAAPIFYSEAATTTYPSNQLARIYANLGDLDRAELEMSHAMQKYPNEESKVILAEVQNIRLRSQAYLAAKPCDDIVISCPPRTAYEFDPGIASKKSMGGSETALIEMAKQLHRQSGKPVKVFNMRSKDQAFDGVEYLSAEKLTDYMSAHEPYLHIAWRHTMKLTNAPTFVWSHDLQTPGVESVAAYDKVLCLTQFHKRYMMATQGVPEHKIHVTRNGIKPERFQDGPWEKDPFKFVFGSSPDRGLEQAIRVLDRVREKHPEVTLSVHYGYDHFYQTGNAHLIQMADRLKAMISERTDWIIYHGATQQDALIRSYKSAAYVVQPSSWIETSCISAMEFLACGVYPIFRDVGGVSDTLGEAAQLGMATLVDSDCVTELEHGKYIDAVLDAIENSKYQRVQIDVDKLGWDLVALEWLKDLPGLAERIEHGRAG